MHGRGTLLELQASSQRTKKGSPQKQILSGRQKRDSKFQMYGSDTNSIAKTLRIELSGPTLTTK